MPNNKLILRSVNSPWVTPFNDITTGSVLSWSDVDNNFIYLKGELIYSAQTIGTTLVLNKINGNDLFVDLDTFEGEGNRWHIPSGTTVEIDTDYQSFIYGDLVIEGLLKLNDGSQLVVINGDIILSGGSISGNGTTLLVDLPEFDTSVTGGTYNQTNGVATFTNNSGGTFNVAGFYTGSTEIFITGGTYNQSNGVATFTNNSGGTFNVDGFLTGYTNYYTTGSTLIGAVAYFDRTDALSAYTLNLSELKFTGNTSGYCINDLWISNLHGCSPITIHDNIQHLNSNASGLLSIAFGQQTIASGDYSHAQGSQTTASGIMSHAEGNYTQAIGAYSHAEGNYTQAIGLASHAEGQGSIANGDFSHAEGLSTTASGQSHAEGILTTASGAVSHAEGGSTIASGAYSHTEGYTTIASGAYSHAEGSETIASGVVSHAEGGTTTASGIASHAEGVNTTASGIISHAEGESTIASGNDSHAEGLGSQAIGDMSHAEGNFTTAIGDNSHAGGSNSIANGDTSFIHSSGSTVTGARSAVIGGQGISGVTDDTVYVPNLNIDTIPENDNALTDVLVRANDGTVKYKALSSFGDIYTTGITINGSTLEFNRNDISNAYSINLSGISETNLGNVLFVSTNGDDLTAQKGDLHNPWRNIYAAKSASTTGDIIYVLPGTWTYDNRNSAGNPYNGQIETKVNLWKNGITYYFLPGSKIIFYNQTVSGQIMYLFNPLNASGEICTVLGDLEWVGNSTGADSSNGHSAFLWLDSSNDNGFTFHAEFKKITSYCSEAIRVNRNVTLTGTTQASVTLIGDEIYREYLGGQSGSNACEFINGSNAILYYKGHVRKRYNIGNNYTYYQFSNNLTRSFVNIYGDYFLSSTSGRCFLFRAITGTINIDIKNIYHGTGPVVDTVFSGGWVLNLNGNIIDNVPNGSSTNGVFWITSGGNTINYNGNISTNIGSGVGRYIAAGSSNNTYNINGDISYLGTGTTTNVIFYSQNNGVINYTGKITGNYAGTIAQTLNGTVNINNSYIKSTVNNSSARLFFNGTTTQGYFRLNNSYVELKNNTSALSNGSYVDSFINNSTIINSGSGDTLSNITNFGKTQILNSTLISGYSGATSILNTGTVPVITSNVTVNTPYNILDIRGNITTLTDLIY